MSWGAIVVGVGTLAYTAYNNKKNRDAAESAADEANTLQAEEAAKLDAEKAKYRAMKFENPYENMENVYEDLTVNQQQAQFQAQQGSQQRANIMQSMRGAAGGSGIAGLAQALANQGQLQTQRISASIGQQESANQRVMAAEASRIQEHERHGELKKQQFETDRQATLLGMQMGQSAGANMATQNAALYQQQTEAAGREAMAGAVGSLAGTVATSDFKTKKTDPGTTEPAWKTAGLTTDPMLGYQQGQLGSGMSGLSLSNPTLGVDTTLPKFQPKSFGELKGMTWNPVTKRYE